MDKACLSLATNHIQMHSFITDTKFVVKFYSEMNKNSQAEIQVIARGS